MSNTVYSKDFERALEVGRPPNIKRLFPNSKALIVSGKAADRAASAKGKCMILAANGRNHLTIRGVLAAAQRANAVVILEIARSEGTYCPTTFFNIARQCDQVMNELSITVPVVIHADHYGIKKPSDLKFARQEIPTIFEAGITSIAIDASHLPDDENLLSVLDLYPVIPDWSGLETEVGEIKGESGLSTPDEALFLIRGLNAHGISPEWIALNNGTTHGIEATGAGINVELTAKIHEAIRPYAVSGAQHGTSGNSTEKLKAIAARTRTTKANVATAFQMIAWGLEVNDYGNAQFGPDGQFVKKKGQGVMDELWEEMTAYAASKNLKGGDYKKLNLPFESAIMAQPTEIRERMVKAVEDFAYGLIKNVFNSADTAPLAVEALLSAGSHDLGPKAGVIENPAEWTPEKIRERAKTLAQDSGPEGNFDD